MSQVEALRRAPAPASALYPAPRAGGADCPTLMRAATLGAMVGGSAAAARQLRRFQSGSQTPRGALTETGKAAFTAGLATVAATAVASTMVEQGLGRLGLMFLVGTAVVYGLQGRGASERRS